MGILNPIYLRAYRLYKYRVFPHVKNRRGATRLKVLLRRQIERQLPTYSGEPESIFEAGEWDNLLLLDGCRHDVYEEVNGETQKRVTLGSCTNEFIKETFSDGMFDDVVYITGNPHFYHDIFQDLTGRNPKGIFREVYNTYDTDWDEEAGVVLPDPLVRDALDAREKHPDARIIVHFMQPHVPFVESDIPQSPNDPVSDLSDINPKDADRWSEIQLAEQEKVPPDTVWEDYRANLEYVMSAIRELDENLDGRTVITSDHGEMIDEKGLYGHPCGSEAAVLREVPYDVF